MVASYHLEEDTSSTRKVLVDEEAGVEVAAEAPLPQGAGVEVVEGAVLNVEEEEVAAEVATPHQVIAEVGAAVETGGRGEDKLRKGVEAEATAVGVEVGAEAEATVEVAEAESEVGVPAKAEGAIRNQLKIEQGAEAKAAVEVEAGREKNVVEVGVSMKIIPKTILLKALRTQVEPNLLTVKLNQRKNKIQNYNLNLKKKRQKHPKVKMIKYGSHKKSKVSQEKEKHKEKSLKM